MKKLQNFPDNGKPTILLLSDDLMAPSGIGTQSKALVINTVEHFNWIQLGAAMAHRQTGKEFDISKEVAELTGVKDAFVKIYPNDGYGDPVKVRNLLDNNDIDGILHFTDPRYWEWLYRMEDEIHRKYKIPLMYYAIWDNYPIPYWNIGAYSSCDLIMGISKQSHLIHKTVLEGYEEGVVEIKRGEPDTKEYEREDTLLQYVPHGIDSRIFFPIMKQGSKEQIASYKDKVENFKKTHEVDFIFYWSNRNIQRKLPGQMILAFKYFVDMLPKKEREKVALLMHTQPVDENGTDLVAVHKSLAPECKVIFSPDKYPEEILNELYNMADVTVNIASNEGFGLSSLESLSTGTPVISNVTGGLQDQMRFEDEEGNWFTPTLDVPSNHTGKHKNCGVWAFPIFPDARSLKGSIPTPFIFDDIPDFKNIADRMFEAYKLRDELEHFGDKGREWVHGDESQMSIQELGKNVEYGIKKCLKLFAPKNRFKVEEVETPILKETGIIT